MAGGAVGMQETVALQIMSGVVHEWVDCEGVQQSELHFEVAGNSFYCPPPLPFSLHSFCWVFARIRFDFFCAVRVYRTVPPR